MRIIDAQDFVFLRDGTGLPFTRFVDALIQAHGFVFGVGEADILTCQRTNLPDGGVDTEVRTPMPGESTSFMKDHPTCWQYKARRSGDITDHELREEPRKHYAADLIARGYAYRLAICDEISAPERERWCKILDEVIHDINPLAPSAEVISTSQFATWANRYPALLPGHFRFDETEVLHFDAWARNITKVTPRFVPVPKWDAAATRIENHLRLPEASKGAVLSVQGMAGVGKTRLVHEVITRQTGMQQLVMYCSDGEDAEGVARVLANQRGAHCILIADECALASRMSITNTLRGHADRIRVVCIDNSGVRPLGGGEEISLEQLGTDDVERVLERNFPRVPYDRRRAYAQLSGGYIRFAADLSEHDAEIELTGHLGPALNPVNDYYCNRIQGDKERRVVEAIALMQKVGFSGSVAGELDELAALTGVDRGEVLEVAATLKDTPGFIVRTTRYLYITPEIIARIAFENAWRRWIEGDPDAFLRKIPPALLESFQARVARSGSAEVRARSGEFFWASVRELRSLDLADAPKVERLARLVDTDPEKYFPKMVSLVDDATLDELREAKGGRGSRRTLVWTAERLAGFPKFFRQSEAMLRRLAIAESETGISNNATGIWKELFRIQLSGSANPFPDRLSIVNELLLSADTVERTLGATALKETLNFMGTRLVGPAVVGGQIVPPNWRPADFQEFTECLVLIIDSFERVFEKGESDVRESAWTILVTHVRSLLGHGLFPRLKALVDRWQVPEPMLPAFLESIEDFLKYECGSADPAGFYCAETRAWNEALTPGDFLGRLKATVGKDPWHHSIREDLSDLPTAFMPLAEELLHDPAKLETSLPFLYSKDAASAGLLGDALARLDITGGYMDRIFEAAIPADALAFGRAYAARLLLLSPFLAAKLNAWIDRLETPAPLVAFWMALATADCSHPLDRAFRMIEAGTIPVQALQHFVMGSLLDQMSSEELAAVLDKLVAAGDAESSHIAVDFVGHCGQRQRHLSVVELEAVWRVLANSAPMEDRADYWWTRGVEALSPESPERGCEVAILALTGEDYEKRQRAWSILAQLGRLQPQLVMHRVGAVMLSKEHSWRLQSSARGGLFQSLPLAVVEAWLGETGVDGARLIAGHLVSPTVDSGGREMLAPLTEFVLSRWGDDEEVFERFAASRHHLQLYTGDMAANHRQEAERAKPFLFHRISAIRRWAENEVDMGEKQARNWDIRNEEQGLL